MKIPSTKNQIPNKSQHAAQAPALRVTKIQNSKNNEQAMCGKASADPKSWIEDIILNFIEQSQENTLQGPFQEKAFENPLVGFANGADPILG